MTNLVYLHWPPNVPHLDLCLKKPNDSDHERSQRMKQHGQTVPQHGNTRSHTQHHLWWCPERWSPSHNLPP